jgi:murein L,D-transpeptidase YafK
VKKTTRKIIIYTIDVLVIALIVYNYWPEQKLPVNAKVDYLLVDKSNHTMKAYAQNQLLKTYTVSFGENPVGHKVYEGDEKTPEGAYTINDRNPNSAYHRNLGVSYPNSADKLKAQQLGKSPGGDIKIHGIRNGLGFINKLHRLFNWTNGCIAVTNGEIEELYSAVEPNAKIEIRP